MNMTSSERKIVPTTKNRGVKMSTMLMSARRMCQGEYVKTIVSRRMRQGECGKTNVAGRMWQGESD